MVTFLCWVIAFRLQEQIDWRHDGRGWFRIANKTQCCEVDHTTSWLPDKGTILVWGDAMSSRVLSFSVTWSHPLSWNVMVVVVLVVVVIFTVMVFIWLGLVSQWQLDLPLRLRYWEKTTAGREFNCSGEQQICPLKGAVWRTLSPMHFHTQFLKQLESEKQCHLRSFVEQIRPRCISPSRSLTKMMDVVKTCRCAMWAGTVKSEAFRTGSFVV